MPSLRARFVRSWVRFAVKRTLAQDPPVDRLRRKLDQLSYFRIVPRAVTREALTIEHVAAEWIIPPNPQGTLLYLHGGGYHFGSIRMYRELAARLALACSARVLVPEYRLAPEHPYPAAVDDARLVYRCLLDQGHAPERLAVAGDSAGGGLTIAATLALRDAGDPLPAALVCLSPWTDLTCSGETMSTCAELDAMLPADIVRQYAASYAAGHDVRAPHISPLFGDLRGLPPLLIHVGTHEVLLSDSNRLAEAARAADVPVKLEVWPEMWHVWHLFAAMVPESRGAITGIAEFIRGAWQGERVPAAANANRCRT
jgi:acetyl esterase/lipase